MDGAGNSHQISGSIEDQDSDLDVVTLNKVKKPSLYKVFIYNDNYTTKEFVIYILQRYFKKSSVDAHQTMNEIHEKGIGLVGVYNYDTAETKCHQIDTLAKSNGHPLKCTFEKE
ncbi:ATP-dependent Clp protease adaptor ClpS [Bacteriovoracaceae bacterium]|nr:ATP-dependent Clp protease adaptor ClpS [Bacteriovoracaceae bacterium]